MRRFDLYRIKHIGFNKAGANRVHCDLVRAGFQSHAARETDHCVLAHVVGALVARSPFTGGGSDIDDASLLALLHVRQTGLGEMQYAKQIHVQQLLKILRRVFQKGFGAVNAGVVDQRVDTAEILFNLSHCLKASFSVCHVQRQRHDLRSRQGQGGGQFVQRVFVSGNQAQRGAFVGVGLCNRLSNATAGTGDDGH